MPLEKDKQMLRILYAVYFGLIAIPVFVVHTILTALIVTVGCLLGGEKFFSFYPGMLWSKVTCRLAMFSDIRFSGCPHEMDDETGTG